MICAKSGDVAMAAFLAVKSWSQAAFPYAATIRPQYLVPCRIRSGTEASLLLAMYAA